MGGGWFLESINAKLPPIKRRRLSKKGENKEDDIKMNLWEANEHWNHCKLQLHCNNLKWVVSNNQ